MKRSATALSEASIRILAEQRMLRREKILTNPSLMIGGIGMCIMVLLAILVPMLTGIDPNEMHVTERLAAPSSAHIFGTDEFGRDIFARVMYGAWSHSVPPFSVPSSGSTPAISAISTRS